MAAHRIGPNLYGKMRPTRIRQMAKRMPIGSHKAIARLSKGEGLTVNRPSWKINGLGYSLCGNAEGEPLV